jgi:hypothetical protein
MMGALFLSLIVAATTLPVWTPPPVAEVERDCRAMYKTAVCSHAFGEWLPHYFDDASPSKPVTRGVPPETFVFNERGENVDQPEGGTFFVNGMAGPPKGDAYYDAAHRIAFFSQGCCSWHEVVLAGAVSAPPVRVRDTDLRFVRTRRGVTLGMMPREVWRRYGWAKLYAMKGHPEVELLSYTSRRSASEGCGNDENFAFRNNRLTLIQLRWAC